MFKFKPTHILITFLALSVGFMLFFLFSKRKEITPQNDITPGSSNINEVIDKQPYLVRETDQGLELYTGQATSSNYTQYVVQNNTVQYFVQKDPKTFEFPNLDQYTSKYGVIDAELYGPWYDDAGFKSYVFIDDGLIVVAHPRSKAITEVWTIPKNLTINQITTNFNNTFSITTPTPEKHF